jgi:hypothetical protein
MTVQPRVPAGPHEPAFQRPTRQQRAWLERGLDQPGGKLPLFDANGQRVSSRTIKSCVRAGWAEPWFANPIKPDWEICKLTERGRAIARDGTGG